jgi:hypothetical protein
LSVDPVADRAAVLRKGAVEASGGEAVSRNASEPGIGLVTLLGVASLPERVRPASIVKLPTPAAIGLLGVVGDGAQRRERRGTWEARLAGVRNPAALWEPITMGAGRSGVGWARRSEEAG